MGIASKVGTLTGTTTTDTITISGLTNRVAYVSVRLRNPASGDKATFLLATGPSAVSADVTIDQDNGYHLDNTRPEMTIDVGGVNDVSIKIRGTASAAYAVVCE